MRYFVLLILVLTGFGFARAEELASPRSRSSALLGLSEPPPPLCALIERSALAEKLPPGFFARLLWKESLFDPEALSPKGAQGVAQFMPATAARRGLADPWDPQQAVPASAAYLADLRRMFGNLGLAAAAYNAGEARVRRWLEKGGSLPGETEDYVRAITFRPADWFRASDREVEPRPLAEGRPFTSACAELAARRLRVLDDGSDWRPWGVQVGAGVSRGAAVAAFERARRAHGAVLDGARPMLVRNHSAARSSAKWMARIGAGSRAEAARLCQRLRGRGGACVVVKTTR